MGQVEERMRYVRRLTRLDQPGLPAHRHDPHVRLQIRAQMSGQQKGLSLSPTEAQGRKHEQDPHPTQSGIALFGSAVSRWSNEPLR